MCLRGPAPTPSVKKLSPIPMRFAAAAPLLGLLGRRSSYPAMSEGHLHRARVVAGVVLPARLRRVRELLGPEQVLHPQLGGIHLELVGEESTMRSTRYTASVIRNEHAYATPPGALFV